MSDLISRQAAIDAILEMNTEHRVSWLDCAIDTLDTLPSVQPEEDCETCKHGYFGGTYCNNCRVRFPSHYERRTDG